MMSTPGLWFWSPLCLPESTDEAGIMEWELLERVRRAGLPDLLSLLLLWLVVKTGWIVLRWQLTPASQLLNTIVSYSNCYVFNVQLRGALFIMVSQDSGSQKFSLNTCPLSHCCSGEELWWLTGCLFDFCSTMTCYIYSHFIYCSESCAHT